MEDILAMEACAKKLFVQLNEMEILNILIGPQTYLKHFMSKTHQIKKP